MRLARFFGLAVVLSVLAASAAGAATLSPIASFEKPMFVTSDRVEPDRLFVAEREGHVVLVAEEGATPQLYADLTELVACCEGERGLLSIALAPGFRTSGRFYALYTGTPLAGGEEGDLHVDAFVADDEAKVTRMPVLTIPHSEQPRHNGGLIQFGPDGYLYISTGDGGGVGEGGDPFENGQSLTTLLGKILRIKPTPALPSRYAIPPGNPFAGDTPGADEIWAYGLRNPFRFSFDSFSGDLLIADVGQELYEELNLATSPSDGVVGGAAANYGWSCREGYADYTDATPTANCFGVSNFTDPIFDYPHEDPGTGEAHGCAITGGYVVRDSSLGDLYGRYVYGDFCTGEIRSLPTAEPEQDRSEGITLPGYKLISFGEDSCHRLYVVAGSSVSRLDGEDPRVCPQLPEEGPPEEERLPDEGGPPGEGPTPPPVVNPIGLGDVPPPRPPYRLSIHSRGQYRHLLAIEVRLLPCVEGIEDSVKLSRNGKPVSTKHLGRDCRARFHVRDFGAPATFRALLRPSADVAVRSRQLVIGSAPSG